MFKCKLLEFIVKAEIPSGIVIHNVKADLIQSAFHKVFSMYNLNVGESIRLNI